MVIFLISLQYMLPIHEIKLILDKFSEQYNSEGFIENDPISIPHRFSKKEDIEIAGFLSASLAWGNRKAIIKSARQLMSWMDNAPFDFIESATPNDLKIFNDFKYRTFNGTDCIFFLKSLQNIYKKHQGLEELFTIAYSKNQSIKDALVKLREVFFEIPFPERTGKHLANVNKNSAAKRLNMFLRWMVRNNNNSVDFGLWKNINPSHLMIPLDVHTGNVARELGLLKRKQNDWKSLEELMIVLREFDADDPVKYDFALFGIGVNKALL